MPKAPHRPAGAGPVPEAPKTCPLATRDLAAKIVEAGERLAVVDEELGFELYEYQRIFCLRVVESVLDNDAARITALWSRQSGKTESVSVLGLGLTILLPALARSFPEDLRLIAFRSGFRLGIFAPVEEQARYPYERMRNMAQGKACQAALADLGVRFTTNRGDTMAFSNGSAVRSHTASPETKLEGDTLHLVILEEAQKLSQAKVDKEIVPMLASTAGSMAKIGTAWESRGGFHNDIKSNIDAWHRGGKRNHFEFPYDKVIAQRRARYDRDARAYAAGERAIPASPFHLKYEKFVAAEIARLGGDESIEFKMNFRCLWNESRVIAVSEEVLDAAALPDAELEDFRGGFLVAGVDFGKSVDSTVVTLLRVDQDNPVYNLVVGPDSDEDRQIYYPKTLAGWLQLEGPFEGVSGQYEAIVDYLVRCGVRVVCGDATGKGDPICERLEAMLGPEVPLVPYVMNTFNKHHLYKYYLQELHAGRVRIPAGPRARSLPQWARFRSEHLSLDRVRHGARVVIEGGEGCKDDFPDSGALACWAERSAPEVVMQEVEVTVSPIWGQGRAHQGPPTEHRYARRWGR